MSAKGHPRDIIPAELAERPFQISVRQLADDLSYGEDASTYVGQGVDYAQSRAFVSGDPVKDIDWRITARSGKYHVKEYDAPKRISMLLLVDTSASMAAQSTPLSKHRFALLLAGALALAGLRRQSPVGVLACGERDVRFTPSLSRGRILQWMTRLWEPGHGERTTLAKTLDQTGAQLKARSLVVVVSDFHDQDAIAALKRIAQAHDVVALQVEDPAERGRLGGGFFRGSEAETGREFVGSSFARWFGLARRHGTPADTVATQLKKGGIDHILLPTDEPFVSRLRHFLRERGVIGRNAR